jgi:hypothetical protein
MEVIVKLLLLMLKRFALVVITIPTLLLGSQVYGFDGIYQGIPKPYPTRLPIDSRMEKKNGRKT